MDVTADARHEPFGVSVCSGGMARKLIGVSPVLRSLRKPQRGANLMARSHRRPLRLTPRRRYGGSRLSTALLVALILFGAFYIAKNQGWIHVGRGGKITVPHITLSKPPVTTTQAPPKVPAGHCDPVLMRHVYHPTRLTMLAACKTVTGVIDLIRLPEPDGDTHVNIRLDAGQEGLVHRPGVAPGSSQDYTNTRFQHGDLVTEAICQHPVIQPNAKAACAGFHDAIKIPPVGAHVEVTGVYVLDQDHGWTELHPVSAIKRIGGDSLAG